MGLPQTMFRNRSARIGVLVSTCVSLLLCILLLGTYHFDGPGHDLVADTWAWVAPGRGGSGADVDHPSPPPPHDDYHGDNGKVQRPQHPAHPPPPPLNNEYQGPRVVALVFFGRRELVSILDCYLKRNLKDNGGLIDEVIFAVNTDIPEDLEYLEKLLPTHPAYRKHEQSAEAKENDSLWGGLWEAVTEPDTIYVKIDDDVVFIDDDAVVSIVDRLIQNPQYFAVSANVVNNPALMWVHFRIGVYEPYWPEMVAPRAESERAKPATPSWRTSDLPSYDGPADGPEDFAIDGSTPAPYEGHRWLPVRTSEDEEPVDITRFPASTLTYDEFGPSLKNWASAAQTHYSFLQHLEQGDTWKYKFDMWDFVYRRLSINFIALRGQDILDVLPITEDDEQFLTVKHPREIRRHVVVDGAGLVVHYAFGPQKNANDQRGMYWTDLLERYRDYARDQVCPVLVDP